MSASQPTLPFDLHKLAVDNFETAIGDNNISSSQTKSFLKIILARFMETVFKQCRAQPTEDLPNVLSRALDEALVACVAQYLWAAQEASPRTQEIPDVDINELGAFIDAVSPKNAQSENNYRSFNYKTNLIFKQFREREPDDPKSIILFIQQHYLYNWSSEQRLKEKHKLLDRLLEEPKELTSNIKKYNMAYRAIFRLQQLIVVNAAKLDSGEARYMQLLVGKGAEAFEADVDHFLLDDRTFIDRTMRSHLLPSTVDDVLFHTWFEHRRAMDHDELSSWRNT